jgi:hypothetical protein
MTATSLDRLVAARPDHALAPSDVTTSAEREAMLRSIVAEPRGTAPPRRHHFTATVIGAAAVATLIGGVLLVDTGVAPSGVDRPSSSAMQPVVLEHIELAVASGSRGVVHIETDFGNDVTWTTWLDETTGRWRSESRTIGGQPLYGHQVDVGDGGTTVVVVSYGDHAWWTYTAPDERSEARLYLTPDEIRAQLRDGTLHELGREGGQIHLRADAATKAPGSFTPVVDLWVDSTSYLPTRSTSQIEGSPPVSATYRWLPRSDDNVRQTELVIPETFVQLPAAPDTGTSRTPS